MNLGRHRGSGADPLGGVRPGDRPSYWLREALGAEPGQPVAPLTGETRADIAIVGGGYTGLCTAFFMTEHDPSARVLGRRPDRP